MGFEKNRFDGEIDDCFICKICKCIFNDPKQLSTCHHIFCIQCIETQIISDGTCPLDGKLIDSANVMPAPHDITVYLGKLKVKCDFYEYGCQQIINLNSLSLHRLNCEYHPERKSKCPNCDSVISKLKKESHNCFDVLRQKIANQTILIEDLKTNHEKELALIKAQQWKIHTVIIEFKDAISLLCQTVRLPQPNKDIISFSCIEGPQFGSREHIIIHSRFKTFNCEANLMTKIAYIKYHVSSILSVVTENVSLFYNGMQMSDQKPLRDYNVRNGSQIHLLPNYISIKIDCVDAKMVISMCVKTNATIEEVITQLLLEIRGKVPDQFYYYFTQTQKALFFNETKLEESYQIANYDVFSMETLKYYAP